MEESPGRLPTVALLRNGYNLLSDHIFGAVSKAGFADQRPSHGNVLEHLNYEDGLRLNELAARARMTPQSIGELVDDLALLGYVERVADPTDRRAKRVQLTRRGRRVAAVAALAVAATEDEIRGKLGARGYRELRRNLEKLLSG
jgi:DNA-binding MarR family transcriptional regulator